MMAALLNNIQAANWGPGEGGIAFENLLRNPSAEDGWVRLRPWLDKLGWQVFPDPYKVTSSVILYTILDWTSGAEYYWSALQRLGRTFWAKFAWGHVPLLGHKPYRPIAVATLLGIIGFVVFIFVHRKRIPFDVAFLFNLVILLIWGFAIIRGSAFLFYSIPPFFPVARYAYPSIVPVAHLLVAGWLALLWLPARWLKGRHQVIYLLPIFLLLTLDIYAIISIVAYYS